MLESAPRAGGSIRTIREDGFVLESGPSTLRTTAAAERLIADLGLEPEVVLADARAPRWIYRGGRPRAIVPGPKGLFNTALTTGGKLRILKDWWAPAREATVEDETVHDFFTRRFGPEAARYGAGPIVSGVYAGDPKSLSVRSAFPALWNAEARAGSVIKDFLKGGRSIGPDGRKLPKHRARTLNFRSGLEQLVEKLVAALPSRGARLVTGAAAVSIDGPAASGPRWTVRTADGRAFPADVLVSTLTAGALARLMGERLPRSSAGLLSVPMSPMAVALQAFRSTPADAPSGFGVLIPRGEGFRSLGVLYPTSLFPGRAPDGWAVTSSFLGGALERDLPSSSDADLLALAAGEVARLHPRLGRPERTWVVRWPEAIPQLPLGHWKTMTALEGDLAALDGAAGAKDALVVTGGFRDGIALGARIERGEAIGAALPVSSAASAA